jgi:hypothetical protein
MPGSEIFTTRHEPLWYKDAVIYEVHVLAFCDSNADGIGDFPGYIADAGGGRVNC